jgi:hypothetical protein
MPARDFPSEFPKPNWLLSINSVQCAIYLGPNPDTPGYGIREGNPQDGRTANVSFICYWDDRMDLVRGLIGDVDYQGGTVVRMDPFAYPLAQNESMDTKVFSNRTFCTSVSSIQGIKPWTDETGENVGLAGWVGYCFAVLEAEFTTPPYLIEDLLGEGVVPSDPSFNDLTYMTYVISKVRVSGEVFSPPTGAFVFAGGGFVGDKLLDVGAAQIRTRFEISCTRVRMPLVPMTIITSLIGTVNSVQFLVGGQMFPVGSMLFTGVNPEPHSDPYNCGIVWDLELTWMANGPASNTTVTTPLDWNFFMDPGGDWSLVQTAAGDPVFQYDDHGQLFDNTIS